MFQGDCVCCGRKARTDGNWLKTHPWGGTAVFDWKCFLSLMEEQGEAAAQDAAWKETKMAQKQ